MPSLEELEQRVARIEDRNKRVEANKAWETSYLRTFLIAFTTYIVIALYMRFVLGINPWVNALVPTVGFVLSTLALSFCRRLWERYVLKKFFTFYQDKK